MLFKAYRYREGIHWQNQLNGFMPNYMYEFLGMVHLVKR